jgi:hypothetical protein
VLGLGMVRAGEPGVLVRHRWLVALDIRITEVSCAWSWALRRHSTWEEGMIPLYTRMYISIL